MMQKRTHCVRRRATPALLLAMLAASGCAKSEPAGSSSSTNFVVCEDDGDCAGHAGAVGCDEQGYCVDADGERIAASDGPVAGSAGGASDAGSTGRNDAGGTGRNDAATAADAAGTDTGTMDAASAEVICDGSDGMRLGITSGGGFVASTYEFTNPYGNQFLFVDGQCRYYVSVDYMQGLATGTLSSAQAEQLAADIGWSMLPAWSTYRDIQCPDAGASTITRPSYAATCICGCQDMGPPGLAAAMTRAFEWVQNLTAQGTPSTGAISAIAGNVDGVSGQELPWPLDRPIADIPGLLRGTNFVPVGPGYRFEDPIETSALRELRSAAVEQVMFAQSIPVIEQDTPFVLYARDDLPDGVDAAIDALQASITP